MKRIWFSVFIALTLVGLSHGQDKPVLEHTITVHNRANIGLNNTPIASRNGYTFFAYVAENTALMVARKDPNGKWTSHKVANKTTVDAYHNAPSIAVDGRGYIHLTGNMHSTPWQYWVSINPYMINGWKFEGQFAGSNPGHSTPHVSKCTAGCLSNWKGKGIAQIPGNQISYPQIVSDYNGGLAISFREAFYPARSNYHAREWSLGLALYNLKAGKWLRPGLQDQPYRHHTQQVPQGATVLGAPNGKFQAVWIWGNHYTPQGGASRPTDPFFKNQQAEHSDYGVINRQGFPSSNEGGLRQAYMAVDSKNRPSVVLETIKGRRKLYRWDGNKWIKYRFTPSAANKILIDANDTYYMVSSGPKVHRCVDITKFRWTTTYTLHTEKGWQVTPDYSSFNLAGKLRLVAIKGNKAEIWLTHTGLPTHDEQAPTTPPPVDPPDPPPPTPPADTIDKEAIRKQLKIIEEAVDKIEGEIK